MKNITPESIEWTQLARFDGQKTEFSLENVIMWLSNEGHPHEVRSGPQNTREIYVLAKPTEIRLAYSKELYKYQHPEVPGKRYSL